MSEMNTNNAMPLSDDVLDSVSGGRQIPGNTWTINCPHCRQNVTIDISKAEQKCPKCGKIIRIDG